MKLGLQLVYGGISEGKSCTCVVPALGSQQKPRILQQLLIVSSELSAPGGVACIFIGLCVESRSAFLEDR